MAMDISIKILLAGLVCVVLLSTDSTKVAAKDTTSNEATTERTSMTGKEPDSGTKSGDNTKPSSGTISGDGTKARDGSRPTDRTESGDGARPTKGTSSGADTKPTDSTRSGDDTRPTTGTKSGDNTKPSSGTISGDGTKPRDGSRTTDRTESGGRTRPTKGTSSGDDTKPTDSTRSGDGTRPTTGTKSGDGSRPTDRTESGGNTRPTKGTSSGDDTKPTDGTRSGDGTRPTTGTKSGDNTKPSSGTISGDGTKPRDGSRTTDRTESGGRTRPTKGTSSGDDTKPTDSTRSGDETKTHDGSRPTDRTESGGRTRPTKGTSSGDDTKPTDGTRSGDGTRPTTGTKSGDKPKPSSGTISGNGTKARDGSRPTDRTESGGRTRPTKGTSSGDDTKPTDSTRSGNGTRPTIGTKSDGGTKKEDGEKTKTTNRPTADGKPSRETKDGKENDSKGDQNRGKTEGGGKKEDGKGNKKVRVPKIGKSTITKEAIKAKEKKNLETAKKLLKKGGSASAVKARAKNAEKAAERDAKKSAAGSCDKENDAAELAKLMKLLRDNPCLKKKSCDVIFGIANLMDRSERLPKSSVYGQRYFKCLDDPEVKNNAALLKTGKDNIKFVFGESPKGKMTKQGDVVKEDVFAFCEGILSDTLAKWQCNFLGQSHKDKTTQKLSAVDMKKIPESCIAQMSLDYTADTSAAAASLLESGASDGDDEEEKEPPSPALLIAAAESLLKGTPSSDVAKKIANGPLCTQLSCSKLKTLQAEDLCPGNTFKTVEKGQMGCFKEKCKDSIGVLAPENMANYSKLLCSFPKKPLLDVIKKAKGKGAEALYSAIGNVCNVEDCMTMDKLTELANATTDILRVGRFKALTTDISALNLRCITKHFNLSELAEALTPDEFAGLCQTQGMSLWTRKKSIPEIRDAWLAVCREAAPQIPLCNMGDMALSATAEHINAMTVDDCNSCCSPLSSMLFKDDVRQALKTVCFNGTLESITALDVERCGSLLTEFTEDELKKIPKTEFASAAQTLTKDLHSLWKKAKVEVNDATIVTSMKGKEKKLMLALADAMSPEAAAGAKSRRKRSASCTDCSTIQSLQRSLASLSEEKLSCLAKDVFDCALGFLGDVPNYEKASLDALATLAKTHIGADLTKWTPMQVTQAGVILSADTFTATLKDLTLESDEAIISLGKHNVWKEAQAASILTKRLADKSVTPETIVAAELKRLGHIACGMTATQIAAVNATEFKEAARAVGSLVCLTDAQLKALKAKAVEAFGTADTWKGGDIAELGFIIAGLDTAELGKLSPDQIASIGTDAIPKFSVDTFKGLSVAQISALSTAQAQAVTPAQTGAFSTEQKSALEEVLGVKKESPQEPEPSDGKTTTERPADGLIATTTYRKSGDSTGTVATTTNRKSGGSAGTVATTTNRNSGGSAGTVATTTNRNSGGSAGTVATTTNRNSGGSAGTVATTSNRKSGGSTGAPGATTVTQAGGGGSGIGTMTANTETATRGGASGKPGKKTTAAGATTTATATDTKRTTTVRSVVVPKPTKPSVDDLKKKEEEAKKKVSELMKNATNMKPEDAKGLASNLGQISAKELEKIPVAVKTAVIKEFVSTKMKETKGPEAKVAEVKMLKLAEGIAKKTDVAKMNQEACTKFLEDNKDVIKFFPASKQEALLDKADVNIDTVKKLSGVKMGEDFRNKLTQKYAKTLTPAKVTTDQIGALSAECKASLPASFASQMPADVAKASFGSIVQGSATVNKGSKAKKRPTTTVYALLGKQLTPADNLDAAAWEAILQHGLLGAMNFSDVQNATADKLCPKEAGVHTTCRTMCSLIYNKCQPIYGAVTKGSLDLYGDSVFQMSEADFLTVTDGSTLLELARRWQEYKKRAQKSEYMNNALVTGFFKMLKDMFTKDSAILKDPANLVNYGGLLGHPSFKSEFKSLQADVLKGVCRMQTEMPLILASSSITDMRTTCTKAGVAYKDLGLLLLNMPVKEIDAMKDADMYQALEAIALGAHDGATRKGVADKMLAYALKLTSSTVETLPISILKLFQTLLGKFNIETLRKINKDTLQQLSTLLAPAYEVQKTICDYRSKEGGFSPSAYCSSGYAQEMKNILAAVAAPAAAAAGKRRKRNAGQTTPVTCIDIIGLGNGVTYLTTVQLKTITDQEFKDCASRLGNPALAFDLEQLGELAALALKYWGDTSTWTPDTVRKAGGMVVGLSVFDLEKLVIADLESAMRIGSAKGWALLSSVDRDTKLSAAFAQFSKGVLASDIKKITGSQLRMISNLACGVSANKIKSEVPMEAIGTSVIELGLLTTCTANQLAEYAQKAIQVHGKIPEPRDMQLLIGGLTGKQLDLIKPSQIKELSPSTIENLPAAILIKFTKEQLEAFTPSMAARMTAEQRKALPEEKREVIMKILKDNLPAEAVRDDADNSAVKTSHNPWIMLTASVVFLLTSCTHSMV